MKKPPRPKHPLNPVILIVLGLAISLYSLFITWTVPDTNKNIMYVFTAIGALFFIVGLIRHLKSRNKSLVTEEREVATRLTNVSVTKSSVNKLQTNSQTDSQRQQKTIILCPKCRSRNYSTSNYCHMCGMRLR